MLKHLGRPLPTISANYFSLKLSAWGFTQRHALAIAIIHTMDPSAPLFQPPDYRKPHHVAAVYLVFLGAGVGVAGLIYQIGWLFFAGVILLVVGFFLFAPVWHIAFTVYEALINWLADHFIGR